MFDKVIGFEYKLLWCGLINLSFIEKGFVFYSFKIFSSCLC